MTEELIVFLLAAMPVSELRGAIPIGISVYGFSIYKTFFIAIIGNFLPVILLIYLLEPVVNFIREKNKYLNSFFTYLFSKTRKKYFKRFEIFGALALITLVAIPLPFTGAWTGALAAYVFGVSKKRSLVYIFLGILIAGIIVTLLTTGVINFYNFIII